MNLDTIKKVILEYQNFIGKISLVKRQYSLEEKGCYVLTGLRHAGKSFLLYQIAKELVIAGHSPTEILYVNFDDERLCGFSSQDFDLILEAYRGLFQCEPILFLDEIQNVPNWERFARRLANEKYQAHITGSNARMLSHEIATTLGGRYASLEVSPYSFFEFLLSRGITLESNWNLSPKRHEIGRLFQEYLEFGGFPELSSFKDRRQWLQTIYRKIILGDVMLRNGLRKEEPLRLCVKKLAECLGQPVSCNRLSNLLAACHQKTTALGVQEHLKLMEEAFLIFPLENAAAKFGIRETVKKYYFSDNGLLNLFLQDPDSALLENLCAIALRRRYGAAVMFYRNGVEIDFYVPEEKLAVQSCLDISDPGTLGRELKALQKLDSRAGLETMLIVTKSQRASKILPNGKSVEIVPAPEWLLDLSRNN